MTNCPKCGTQIAETASFCPTCGERIAPVTKQDLTETLNIFKAKRKLWYWTICVPDTKRI